jgi:histone H3/H4
MQNSTIKTKSVMEKLVADLRKMALKLQNQQEFTFTMSNGRDITDLVGQCKTQEDILRVANLIRDMLIPELNEDDNEDLNLNQRDRFGHENAEILGTDQQLMNLGWEEDEPNDEITRSIITAHYFPLVPENAEDEESDSFEELSEVAEDNIQSLLTQENIDTNWKTWAECFKALGYPYPPCFEEYFFDDPMDIMEICESVANNNPLDCDPDVEDGEVSSYAYTRTSYVTRFYRGELSELEAMDLATEIIEWCEQDKLFALEEDQMTDSSEEQEDEIKSLFLMVSKELQFFTDKYDNVRSEELQQVIELYKEQSNEVERDPEILMDIWTRIDALHEIQEDLRYNKLDSAEPLEVTKTEKRKRARIEYDIEDQPLKEIHFEQRQTDLIIDPKSMKMLIKEIGQDFKDDLRFDDDAFEAIQTAAEAYLIEVFGDANRVAIDAELTHIAPKHMQVAKRIKEGDQ